jgi:hypothetical protein
MGIPGSPHIYSALDYILKADGVALNIQTSDPQDKSRLSRAIAVMGGGTLDVVRYDDSSVTLPACPDGFIWDIQAKSIGAGSSATGVVVLY